MKKTILALSLILSTSAYSLEIENKEDYLVKKGDTLMGHIRSFLKKPLGMGKVMEKQSSYN